MSMLLILLIAIGPFVVVAPGALLTAIQLPEAFGRPHRTRPVAVVRRWQVA